jgi:hypothetical protein
MKHNNGKLVIIAVALLMASASSWASGPDYGAAAATAAIAGNKAFTVTDMLRWAAGDEYLAHGEYATIIKKFGNLRPYSNIIKAEEQHLDWLRTEYKARGLAFPSDGSAPYVVAPADLKSAAQAGVDAEIANIDMYRVFLSRPELSRSENASAKTLFDQLMRASENHLRAFKTQLAKY